MNEINFAYQKLQSGALKATEFFRLIELLQEQKIWDLDALSYLKDLYKKELFDDLLTCTMTLDNINPMFHNTYMLFNNQKVLCGPCNKGVLNMVVNSCGLDEDGSALDSCSKKGQKAEITSSLGNPITFVGNVTPENLSNFFCINGKY
jgi:hypothetical protein